MTSPDDLGIPLVVFDRNAHVRLSRSGALPRSEDSLDWEALQDGVGALSNPLGAPLLPLFSWKGAERQAQARPAALACLQLQDLAGLDHDWPALAPGQALDRVCAADRATLAGVLQDRGRTAIGTSPPWLDPLWWVQALAWMDAAVPTGVGSSAPELRIVKPPWGGSVVLECRTRDALLFFKASAGEPSEAQVMQQLVGLLPEAAVPQLVAHDERLGCMLMRASTGSEPRSASEHALAVRSLAQLQVAQHQAPSQPFWDRCARRDGQWLAEQAELLLQTIPQALIAHGVVTDSAQQLASRLRAARRCCAALDAGAWPLALHHEDFRPGNVLVDHDRVCILDWADTVMAHPAFSLLRYLEDLQGDTDSEAAACAAFEEVWAGVLPAEAVRTGIDAARRLATLYETARHVRHMDVPAWAASNPGLQERGMAQGLMDRLLAESLRW